VEEVASIHETTSVLLSRGSTRLFGDGISQGWRVIRNHYHGAPALEKLVLLFGLGHDQESDDVVCSSGFGNRKVSINTFVE